MQSPKPEKQKSFKPASTLLLILSIVFSPILWLVDPGAMTNFWATRFPRASEHGDTIPPLPPTEPNSKGQVGKKWSLWVQRL
jgi:hypothetical protein